MSKLLWNLKLLERAKVLGYTLNLIWSSGHLALWFGHLHRTSRKPSQSQTFHSWLPSNAQGRFDCTGAHQGALLPLCFQIFLRFCAKSSLISADPETGPIKREGFRTGRPGVTMDHCTAPQPPPPATACVLKGLDLNVTVRQSRILYLTFSIDKKDSVKQFLDIKLIQI